MIPAAPRSRKCSSTPRLGKGRRSPSLKRCPLTFLVYVRDVPELVASEILIRISGGTYLNSLRSSPQPRHHRQSARPRKPNDSAILLRHTRERQASALRRAYDSVVVPQQMDFKRCADNCVGPPYPRYAAGVNSPLTEQTNEGRDDASTSDWRRRLRLGAIYPRDFSTKANEVVGLDCLTPDDDERLKRENLRKVLEHANFQFVNADLTSAVLTDRLDGCDVVFHQAAQPGVRASWSQFHTYVSHNIAPPPHRGYWTLA